MSCVYSKMFGLLLPIVGIWMVTVQSLMAHPFRMDFVKDGGSGEVDPWDLDQQVINFSNYDDVDLKPVQTSFFII